MCKTLIIIPARLQASRLPQKPLAPIAGEPMIVHVWRRATESGCGEVVVATDSEEISAAVSGAGGKAVLTDPDHQSGSDRVYEALSAADPDKTCDIVVNLQGDLPTLDPALVATCVDALAPGEADIATLACEIAEEEERTNPNVVKVVGTPAGESLLRALYFTRATAPYGEGPLYHHIGIYAYRRAALERFVSMPPSTLEKREKLEQLRALEAGMRINVALVDTVPLGVDTPVDLARARGLMENPGTS
ncbi:3-deoxy-manno-octulosonate cytidylyltransferase [Methyloligella halotolerans]|uniref:3-deoxy-manno-octulosonate cytidylyltransferase n=1 Tax=Methyloligella halotolerans TaxID=1177755 RepID=A0A1E2RWE1_9HYPH|nr:3-deoxy-manno-octulosonate cytidylyltransferase [Methyloligella halotolerans]ODA66408.1 3-deoxy-manno-octulosonate cytidylyltransferase [Methyloligella halotolerans]